jgi:hypothetical protein
MNTLESSGSSGTPCRNSASPALKEYCSTFEVNALTVVPRAVLADGAAPWAGEIFHDRHNQVLRFKIHGT